MNMNKMEMLSTGRASNAPCRHRSVESSDHNLVTAKVRLKLRKTKIGTSNNKRFDVTSLKDTGVGGEFNITLSALQDETVYIVPVYWL